MANVNRKRTVPTRTDPRFADLIKEVQAKNLKEKKKFVKSARVTKAMYNQYMKYPELMKELLGANLN